MPTVALLAADRQGVELPARSGGEATMPEPSRALLRVAAGPHLLLTAALGLAVLLVGFSLDKPLLVLMALVLSTVSLLMRWSPADVAVPAAVLALLSAALFLGVGADALGLDLLSRPALLMVGYTGYATWAVAIAARRPSSGTFVVRAAPRGRSVLAAYVPAVIATGVGLRQIFDERLASSWAMLGTDAARHMDYLRQAQQSGALDYGDSGYPRALHMLAAVASVPGAPLDSPTAALSYDLGLMAGLTCMSLALVLWTGACAVLRGATALGLSRTVSVLGALAFGLTVLLLSSYIRAFVFQAAAPSLLATVVLWSLPLTALVLNKPRNRLVILSLVSVTSVMLMAHLWQALALAPVLALAFLAAPQARRPRQLLRAVFPGVRTGAVLVLWSVMCAAVSVLPMLAIQQAGGMAVVAAIPGMAPGAPTTLLALSLVTLVALAGAWTQDWARSLLGAGTGLLAVAALMLQSNGQGFDLSQYYPQKVLWFFAVLLLPVVAVLAVAVMAAAGAAAWRALGRLGSAARLSRAAAVCVMLALLFAYVAPLLVVKQPAVLSTVAHRESGQDISRRFDIAEEHASSHLPAVAVPVGLSQGPLPDTTTTPVISTLMAFQTGQPTNTGKPDDVCDDIRLVAGNRPAVVVTALELDYMQRLMQRRGCGAVPVVRVPGGGADAMFLPEP